jgi:hypothetical protein
MAAAEHPARRSTAAGRLPRRPVIALLALLVWTPPLAGCGLPTREAQVVDFVQLDDRRYVRIDGDAVEAPDPSTLGPEVAWTARKVGDPEGAPVLNGDAAYLEPGTPLRAVAGFEPWFRLAAELPEGETALYELSTREGARTGDDLLDLSPGAVAVSVEDADRRDLGLEDDPAAVGALVSEILDLPVQAGSVTTERPELILEIRFPEPLAPVRRAVFVGERSLGDQLRLDDATLCTIEQVAGRPCGAAG